MTYNVTSLFLHETTLEPLCPYSERLIHRSLVNSGLTGTDAMGLAFARSKRSVNMARTCQYVVSGEVRYIKMPRKQWGSIESR